MRLSGRVQRLERRLSVGEELPWPCVVLGGPKDEDRPVVTEIVRARLERSRPWGLVITYVTAEDVAAWREGRKEEAVAGVDHRWSTERAGRTD